MNNHLQEFHRTGAAEVNDPARPIPPCGRCQSNDVICCTRQMRSGDESAIIIYECNACQHRWV